MHVNVTGKVQYLWINEGILNFFLSCKCLLIFEKMIIMIDVQLLLGKKKFMVICVSK